MYLAYVLLAFALYTIMGLNSQAVVEEQFRFTA
jgi:hypothetical protein